MSGAASIPVPAGTQPSPCRGRTCGRMIYWVERPSAGDPRKTVRIPVDCDERGGQHPDSLQPGRGISHFRNCPNAGDF